MWDFRLPEGSKSLGTLLLGLFVLIVGLSIGAGIHFVALAFTQDWLIHALVWPLLLFAVYKLWRASQQYRSLDPEAASRKLAEQFARDEARRAAERQETEEKKPATEDSSGKPPPPSEQSQGDESSTTTSSEPPAPPPAAPK